MNGVGKELTTISKEQYIKLLTEDCEGELLTFFTNNSIIDNLMELNKNYIGDDSKVAEVEFKYKQYPETRESADKSYFANYKGKQGERLMKNEDADIIMVKLDYKGSVLYDEAIVVITNFIIETGKQIHLYVNTDLVPNDLEINTSPLPITKENLRIVEDSQMVLLVGPTVHNTPMRVVKDISGKYTDAHLEVPNL